MKAISYEINDFEKIKAEDFYTNLKKEVGDKLRLYELVYWKWGEVTVSELLYNKEKCEFDDARYAASVMTKQMTTKCTPLRNKRNNPIVADNIYPDLKAGQNIFDIYNGNDVYNCRIQRAENDKEAIELAKAWLVLELANEVDDINY